MAPDSQCTPSSFFIPGSLFSHLLNGSLAVPSSGSLVAVTSTVKTGKGKPDKDSAPLPVLSPLKPKDKRPYTGGVRGGRNAGMLSPWPQIVPAVALLFMTLHTKLGPQGQDTVKNVGPFLFILFAC